MTAPLGRAVECPHCGRIIRLYKEAWYRDNIAAPEDPWTFTIHYTRPDVLGAHLCKGSNKEYSRAGDTGEGGKA